MTYWTFMDDCRMSWSRDEACDCMLYSGTKLGSNITADAELPGVAWLDGLLTFSTTSAVVFY
jgi:hypothetical protein